MPWWTQPEQHTARIGHRCSLCGRVISPGETYTKTRGYDAGDAWTWKACPHCSALVRVYDLFGLLDWDGNGLTSEDVREWAKDRSDLFAEARAKHGFVNQWRRRGVLLPVPTDGS